MHRTGARRVDKLDFPPLVHIFLYIIDEKLSLIAPHRTVRAVFPHTALHIILKLYQICTYILGSAMGIRSRITLYLSFRIFF